MVTTRERLPIPLFWCVLVWLCAMPVQTRADVGATPAVGSGAAATTAPTPPASSASLPATVPVYFLLGLAGNEVEHVLGQPNSRQTSGDDEIWFYGRSQVYIRSGRAWRYHEGSVPLKPDSARFRSLLASILPGSLPATFSVGAPAALVLRLAGPPDGTRTVGSDQIWFYGNSQVYLHDGRVAYCSQVDRHLPFAVALKQTEPVLTAPGAMATSRVEAVGSDATPARGDDGLQGEAPPAVPGPGQVVTPPRTKEPVASDPRQQVSAPAKPPTAPVPSRYPCTIVSIDAVRLQRSDVGLPKSGGGFTFSSGVPAEGYVFDIRYTWQVEPAARTKKWYVMIATLSREGSGSFFNTSPGPMSEWVKGALSLGQFSMIDWKDNRAVLSAKLNGMLSGYDAEGRNTYTIRITAGSPDLLASGLGTLCVRVFLSTKKGPVAVSDLATAKVSLR